MINLYPHQQLPPNKTQALYWDMGLGKTYAALAQAQASIPQDVIVVCPAAVIEQWQEATRALNLTKHTSIVSYSSIWRPAYKHLYTFAPNSYTLILDECQKINNKSKQTKACLTLAKSAHHTLLLSGTPCDGKYEKLYNQLQVLGYEKNEAYYLARYCKIAKINFGNTPYPVKVVQGYKNVDELQAHLTRLGADIKHLDDINITLPPTRHEWHRVKACKEYNILLKDKISEHFVADTTSGDYHARRQLSTLAYNKDKKDYIENLIESTASRIVILYNYRCELEVIKELAHQHNRPLSQVNGDAHDLSNYHDHDNAIIAVQYQAGSTGLNLQRAHYCIVASPPVSYIDYSQALARVHRIGQEHKVVYYHPTADGIEQRIYHNLKNKKDYTEKLFAEEEAEHDE